MGVGINRRERSYGERNGEAEEREAPGQEKLQVIWGNIDGNRVV